MTRPTRLTSFKKISQTATSLALSALLYASSASTAFAQNEWGGRCVDGPNRDVATIHGIECLVANLLNVAITMIGLGAFLMMIVGAFRYLTAGTNPKSTENAKNGITFAIAGLVLAVSSFIILRLLASFTGMEDQLLKLQLPG